MGVKDEIYGAVVAEIKHAYMIWDAPPPEAIARAVLVVASKQLLENIDSVAKDISAHDAYRMACNNLDPQR
jgi:hypothetical protein